MIGFDTPDREAYFRAQTQKQHGLVLNVPQKKTCACCGVTRNALTQFRPGSAVCHNCRRPR